MTQITLTKGLHKYNETQSSQCWLATWTVDGQPAADILDIMGTHILPTGYTWNAPGSMVGPEIQALNPDALVVVIES